MRQSLLIAIVAAACSASVGCAVEDVKGSPLAGSSRREDPAEGDDADAKEEEVLAAQEGAPLPVAPGPSATSAACAENDLALCFSFDGSAVDQSGAAIQPEAASGIAFVAGKAGMAGSFGAASALRFAANPAFDLPAGAATIEAWINRTATGADAVVFDDDARFSLTINAAGQVWCKSSGGAIVGVSVLPAAKWVHVACVIDRGTMRAYVDGAADAVGAGSITPSPTSGAAIGGNAPSGEAFSGMIDSLRVFRVARTPEQIAAAAK